MALTNLIFELKKFFLTGQNFARNWLVIFISEPFLHNAGRCSGVLMDGASRTNRGKKNNSAIVGNEQVILADLLFHQNKILTSLSWVVPSSVVWVEVGLGWVEAELELKLSWDCAWQVFELFNWSIWSFVPFYYFSVKWVGGWLCYLKISLKVEVEVKLSWVEAEVYKQSCISSELVMKNS